MNITQNTNKNNISLKNFIKLYFINFSTNWYRIIIIIIIFFSITSFGVVCFYYGAQAHRQHLIRGQFINAIQDIISTNYHIPYNYIRSLFSKPETINIDIKFKNLQKMEFNKVSLLKEEKISENIKNITYPANLKFENLKYAANISLYGTFLDHINSDQYSMRIKIKKNKTIMGMREFVLLNPKVRYGIYDWLGHKIMGYENLISLRYKFVNIILNGDDKGIYVLEELFNKRLIENNHQREGIIVRPLSPIKFHREKKLLRDPNTKSTILLLKKLFKSYQQKVLPPNQLFDYNKMARFLSVIKLIRGEHALLMNNIRFYFNPITSKLEPIGREFNIKSNIDEDIFQNKLYKLLMNDPSFVEQYVKHLLRISEPVYLQNFFLKYDNDLKTNENILHRQQPYHTLNKSYLYQQQEKIKSELTLNIDNVKTVYELKGEELYLVFTNLTNYPLLINDITSNSKSLNNLFNQSIDNSTPLNRGKNKITIRIPDDKYQEVIDSLGSMEVSLRIIGNKNHYQTIIFPSRYELTRGFNLDLMRKFPNPDKFKFLLVNEEDNEINFKSGHWDISEDIILPPGFVINCLPGTHLNLSNGASLISYSPLKFYGTATNPIKIQSSDSTGRGILILKTNREATKMAHVVFHNLAKPKGPGLNTTSSITFYESDVHLENTRFLSNRDSDDALNIFRSKFSISKSLFSNSNADALDIDFSDGDISDVVFNECGAQDDNGDCIDISGAVVNLKNIQINGASDKALSIGEKSRVNAKRIKINYSKVAIASKDSSIIELDDIIINSSSFGFTAYQKKTEFGPARISAQNYFGKSIDTLHLLDKGSTLILNGSKIKQFSKKHPLKIISKTIYTKSLN